MKLLIFTPFLKNIGGTEIETLLTIKEFQKNNIFEEVVLFCPHDLNLKLFEWFRLSQKVKIIKYPVFFRNKYFRRIDKEFRKILKLKSSPAETFFWLLKRKNDISFIYVLSSSSNNYFLPMLKWFPNNRVLIKYTTIYNQNIPPWKKQYLKAVKYNVVMSKNHETFLRNQNISNILVQDVLIGNERELLKCQSNRKYTFGIFCRLSPEKGIEDGINMVKYLHDCNFNASLLIDGFGEDAYSDYLESLIKEYELQDYIRLTKKKVLPDQAVKFYEKISFFLITSKFEGGPMTGLEAMAAGVPVLTYKVGAMADRLENHQWLLVNNYDELKEKALQLMSLSNSQFQQISNELRNHYCLNLSNDSKIKKLAELFE